MRNLIAFFFLFLFRQDKMLSGVTVIATPSFDILEA